MSNKDLILLKFLLAAFFCCYLNVNPFSLNVRVTDRFRVNFVKQICKYFGHCIQAYRQRCTLCWRHSSFVLNSCADHSTSWGAWTLSDSLTPFVYTCSFSLTFFLGTSHYFCDYTPPSTALRFLYSTYFPICNNW